MTPRQVFRWLLCVGALVLMSATNWLAPNWRHELSNAVLAWIVIGIIAGVLALAWWRIRKFPTLPLFGAIAVGAGLGAGIGGLAWIVAPRAAPANLQEEIRETGNDPVQPRRVAEDAEIRSIVVEGRLTALLKEGAAIPPASVDFTPIGGGSDGKLVGPGGEFTLKYVSPTVFRRLEGNRIVVVNTFSLPASSALVGRPVSSLESLEQVHVPVVTIVYREALDVYSLAEVTISVNGRAPWYYSWKLLPGKFQGGMVLHFPLRDPSNPFTLAKQ